MSLSLPAVRQQSKNEIAVRRTFPEGRLSHIPAQELLNGLFYFLEQDNIKPGDQLDGFILMEIIDAWNVYLNKTINQGPLSGWKYFFNYCFDPDLQRFFLSLIASRGTMRMRLMLSDAHFAPGYSLEDLWGDAVNKITRFLFTANKNIDQWNYICSSSLPLFDGPPPRDAITESFFQGLYDFLDDHLYYEDYLEDNESFEGSFDQWVEQDGWINDYSFAWILNDSFSMVYQDWHIFAENHVSGDYGYVSFYIKRQGLGLVFCPLLNDYDQYGYVHFIEVGEAIKRILDDIEGSMLEWNKFVETGFKGIKGILSGENLENIKWEETPDWLKRSATKNSSLFRPEKRGEIGYCPETGCLLDLAFGYTQLELPLDYLVA